MNNKSFTVKDHIGIFDNYFSDGLCEKYIRYFEKVEVSQRDNFNVAEDKYLFLMNEHFHNEYHDLATILIPPLSVVQSAEGSQLGTYRRLSSLPVLDYQEIFALHKRTIKK